MINTYDIYLISDSTGETLERIFLAIKAQFKNFKYKTHFYSFTRTENQISKILEVSQKNNNVIVLYTIVDNKLARHLSNECSLKNIPCFGILGDLIISFSKLLDQKALNVPSRQHIMDDEYYKKIEAIQFTMNHDDGNSVDDIEKSDIILLGVSRTSKTPTSIYLANKGMKISNILSPCAGICRAICNGRWKMMRIISSTHPILLRVWWRATRLKFRSDAIRKNTPMPPQWTMIYAR